MHLLAGGPAGADTHTLSDVYPCAGRLSAPSAPGPLIRGVVQLRTQSKQGQALPCGGGDEPDSTDRPGVQLRCTLTHVHTHKHTHTHKYTHTYTRFTYFI